MPKNGIGPDSRVTSVDRYCFNMDLALEDKLKPVLPYLKPHNKIVSVGAGTGSLEDVVAKSDAISTVYAVDFSTEMIDRIAAKNQLNLKPIWANAIDLQSHKELQNADIVLAFSVIHEFASFLDYFTLGQNTQQIIKEMARILKPGGVLIVRDFVAPEFFDKQVKIICGQKMADDEMTPQEFLDKYGQIAGIDASKPMSFMQAVEFLTHFSWHKSFADESKERYFYLPMSKYAQMVSEISGTKNILADSHLQDGYIEHIRGRLSMVDLNNNPVYLPPITGTMVFKKI